MKLHVFDSCPFCVRVKTVIGLKNLNLDIHHLVLGELPEVLEEKLGRFSVPALELVNPENGTVSVMIESLDIIKKLDQLSEPLFDNYRISEEIQLRLAQLKPITAQLLYPRMPKLNLPELASDSALTMFVESRKEILGQTIEQAIEKTENYLPPLEEQLSLIEQELDIEAFISGRRKLTIDDIAAFSELRNYTMIAELTFSETMQRYIEIISSRSNVSVYPPISK